MTEFIHQLTAMLIYGILTGIHLIYAVSQKESTKSIVTKALVIPSVITACVTPFLAPWMSEALTFEGLGSVYNFVIAELMLLFFSVTSCLIIFAVWSMIRKIREKFQTVNQAK